MFSENNEGQQGLALSVVFTLLTLVVVTVIGFAIQQSGSRLKATPGVTLAEIIPAVATTALPHLLVSPLIEEPASAAAAAQAASDAASIQVEQGVVKFYFASGSAALAQGAGDALADMVKAARASEGRRKLVISGFHDSVGDPLRNAELARRRALAVSAVLKADGVVEAQIELAKPKKLSGSGSGSGSDANARRVEISLQ
jgi:outer membrane protein OmpA-like peptidoglycan-associated protein